MPAKKTTKKNTKKASTKKTTPTKTTSRKSKGLNGNEMMTAILAYLGILVVIPLLAIEKKQRNDFIKFHLEQGLNLFLIEIIIWIVLVIISLISLGILAFLIPIFWILTLIIVIVAIVKATQGNKWEIPVIGKWKIIKL